MTRPRTTSRSRHASAPQSTTAPQEREQHDDARRARVLEITPEPWRWAHPRVLIEHPDANAGLAIASGLRFAGYSVAVCPGPREPGQCPLCGFDGCPTAHDADLVVSCLGCERDAAREVVSELRARCPNVPLLVETPPELDAELRELLVGCSTLPAPATPEQVIAAAQELLGRPTHEGEPRA